MKRLRTILQALCERCKIDWIIEEGTDGIWTYRKWASGIAECWGASTHTVANTTSWVDHYISSAQLTATYPSGLFASKPLCNYALSSGSNFWILSGTGGSNSTTDGIYTIRPDSYASATVTIQWRAVGRWK